MKKLLLVLAASSVLLLGACVDADDDGTVFVDTPDTTIVEPPADVDIEIDGD